MFSLRSVYLFSLSKARCVSCAKSSDVGRKYRPGPRGLAKVCLRVDGSALAVVLAVWVLRAKNVSPWFHTSFLEGRSSLSFLLADRRLSIWSSLWVFVGSYTRWVVRFTLHGG